MSGPTTLPSSASASAEGGGGQAASAAAAAAAAQAALGRPCAQCQARHVSCDRQRPCRRCTEAGPGLASACCDPPAAPKKRGRPPGSKRRTTAGSQYPALQANVAPLRPLSSNNLIAVDSNAMGTVLMPPHVPAMAITVTSPTSSTFVASSGLATTPTASAAPGPSITWFGGNGAPTRASSSSPPPKRPRFETQPDGWSAQSASALAASEYSYDGSSDRSESSPYDEQTGSPVTQTQQTAAPQTDLAGGSETVGLMRSILDELRGLRSDYTIMMRRQEAMEDRLNALATSIDNQSRQQQQQQQQQLFNRIVPSHCSASSVIFPKTMSGERPIAATWEDVVAAFNKAAEVAAHSSSSSTTWTRWSSAYMQTSSPIPSTLDPSPHQLSSSSTSFSVSLSYSSLMPTSPPLPANVPPNSFDVTRPRVLAVLPYTHLSNSFDRPWFMERMVTVNPADPAKHQLPSPDLLQYFGNKRTVVTASNEAFHKLSRYSSEELLELNSMWLYPTLAREKLAILYRDWLSKQAPAFLSPVFLVTCPLLTRDGTAMHTLSRTQLYYNEEGDYAWSMSVLDYWSPVEQHELEHGCDRVNVEDDLEALLRECQSPSISLLLQDSDDNLHNRVS